jgi:microcystin-dependent protein
LATLTQVQINTSLNVLQNISFLGSLNGITTNTFSFLSGLSSNIQNQINSITNTTPVGTVIQFAGNASYLNAYLKCDGTLYTISSYQNLYNVIGTMYGGDASLGYFNVPNYQGVFLRGAGSQNLDLVYGQPAKQYTSPPLGAYVVDKSVQPSNYVTGINQTVKSFLEKANSNVIGISFTSSNAVSSLQYSTASDNGVVESAPVHTSISYFIKY